MSVNTSSLVSVRTRKSGSLFMSAWCGRTISMSCCTVVSASWRHVFRGPVQLHCHSTLSNAFSNRMCDRQLVSGWSSYRKVPKSGVFKLACASGVGVCSLGRVVALASLSRASSVGMMLTLCVSLKRRVFVRGCLACPHIALLRSLPNMRCNSRSRGSPPSWMNCVAPESRTRKTPASFRDAQQLR